MKKSIDNLIKNKYKEKWKTFSLKKSEIKRSYIFYKKKPKRKYF